MATLEIILAPDLRLKAKAKPVKTVDDDVVTGIQQGFQGGGGEIRRAGKHNAHVGCFSVSLIRKNRVVTRS